MKPTPNDPLDSGGILEHASSAVRSHQKKIRVLTIAAFALGFIAVAGSIWIVTMNELYVRPKQIKLAQEAGMLADAHRLASPTLEGASTQASILSLEVTMMRVVSTGTILVAGSVCLLGLGTLSALTVVVLNRRATLNQVNASLRQISAQLSDLRNG